MYDEYSATKNGNYSITSVLPCLSIKVDRVDGKLVQQAAMFRMSLC